MIGTPSGIQHVSDGSVAETPHSHPVELGAEFVHGERNGTARSTWSHGSHEMCKRWGELLIERNSMWVARAGNLEQLTGAKGSPSAVIKDAIIDSVWNEEYATLWLANNPGVNPDTTTAAHLIPSSGTNSLTEETTNA